MSRNILIAIPVTKEHKALLEGRAKDAEFIYKERSEITKDDVLAANMIVGNVREEWLADSENLEVMQLDSAGTGGYVKEGVLPKGTLLCNASGAYGTAISEHMLACTLMLQKKLHFYLENMKEPVWRDEGPVEGFFGATVLVVGLGDIGGEFAMRAHALGARTIGIVRTLREKPEYLDELYDMSSLPGIVSRADVVASSLPSTPLTRKIYNAELFAKMKPSAVFVNVGRGDAVDTDALCEALNAGVIGGAALDVTDPEPLPLEHPLWQARNLMLTPHISGGHHMKITWDKIVEIAADNIEALERGGEFRSVVDLTSGYRKSRPLT